MKKEADFTWEALFRHRSFWLGVIFVSLLLTSALGYYFYLNSSSYHLYGESFLGVFGLLFLYIYSPLSILYAPLGLESYLVYIFSGEWSIVGRGTWRFLENFLLFSTWGSFLLFLFYLPSLSRKLLIRTSLVFLFLILLIIVGCAKYSAITYYALGG